MTELILNRASFDAVVEHARRESPLEACGILSGKGGRVESFHPMTNADQSPDHFAMDPKEQFAVARTIRALSHEMLAIVHSHPATPARPSEEDIRLAVTPGVVYVILSIMDPQAPVLKGFLIGDARVTEVPITTEEAAVRLSGITGDDPLLRLPESVHADVAEYRARVEEQRRGATTPVAFRAFRVPMGVYEQRQAGRYMVRVRIGAGLALPWQLRRIAELSEAHGNGVVHVTTRQDLQVHNLSLEDTVTVQEKLLEVGLSARGGGGNTVRNITACPRSSVCPKAVFDVAPHAIALAEALLGERSSFNLPRKFKLAFSACSDDCAFASVNDLGFFAHQRGSHRGFAVYAGGGLGPKPKAGVLIEEFIEEHDLFEVAEAVKNLFDQLGDRADKHHARLRFVLGRLGDEAFVRAYRERREAVRTRGPGRTRPPIRSLAAYFQDDRAHVELSAEASRVPEGVLPDRQCGKFTVEVRLKHGQIPAGDLATVASIAERLGAGVVTATQDQNLLLPGVAGPVVSQVHQELGALSIDPLAHGPKVVACAGASTCKLGLCLSPALADVLTTRLGQAKVDGASGLSAIRISGCPNSCGNHLIAELGLEGTTRRHKGRLLPCYEVLAGGSVAEGNACLGERLGVVPARAVPDLLVAAYARGATDMDGLRELVKLHARLPEDLPEEHFVDFGASEPFTLKGRGPGECGAGVLDIVRADMEEARAAVSAHAGGVSADERSRAIYHAALATARALLPIFGLDAKKDREIFDLFGKRLVEPGWVKPEAQPLLDAAVDWRLGDLDSLEGFADVAKHLTQRVEELFQSLDGRLEFRAAKVAPHQGPRPQDQLMPTELDLRGVACPMNFVKTKVALEKLLVGDTLDVLLDDGEPIRNVPASLTEQGQNVLSVSREGDHFRVRVRRNK